MDIGVKVRRCVGTGVCEHESANDSLVTGVSVEETVVTRDRRV